MSLSSKLYFEIAGLNIKLLSELPFEKIKLSERILSFSVPEVNQKEDLTIHLKEIFEIPSPLGDLIYDPGDIWRMYKHENTYNAAIYYNNPEPFCYLSTDTEWNEINMTENFAVDKKNSSINFGTFELIVRAGIQRKKGMLFHSSGIDDNGKGIVIVGHSGEGKSTQSRYWNGLQGALIMNEDRVAVRETDEEYISYGTPWGGTANIARNHKVPLTAIILIEKSQTNKIEKLSPSDALPLLMVRSFFPYWDEELVKLAVSNLNSLVSKVPVYRLHCYPGPEVVELVRSVL
ncbi:MAG: hypothetical protein WC139_09640 [Candidatus Kapaibacterium sp.]